ncbi:hypothetical protein [uncultured Chryseobacterium sp.]|uniref:hypothetical protein n=1 Tax=uncultured Chryseobacterium sp. TaxID=259322 RepID=UPI0025F40913|nr:hypothetical protein [uncultured Chryseobacterium sp.]
MKKLIPSIILTFVLLLLNACFKANDHIGHDGRCTGSAYCSACTNCSRCGHCGSGGTCGVCGGGSSGSNPSSGSSPRKNGYGKHKSSNDYSVLKTESRTRRVAINEANVNTGTANRYLVGVGAAITIYEKPVFRSNVVAIVTRNAKIIQLSRKGDWYKVQVESSGKKGYVYYKNLK